MLFNWFFIILFDKLKIIILNNIKFIIIFIFLVKLDIYIYIKMISISVNIFFFEKVNRFVVIYKINFKMLVIFCKFVI